MAVSWRLPVFPHSHNDAMTCILFWHCCGFLQMPMGTVFWNKNVSKIPELFHFKQWLGLFMSGLSNEKTWPRNNFISSWDKFLIFYTIPQISDFYALYILYIITANCLNSVPIISMLWMKIPMMPCYHQAGMISVLYLPGTTWSKVIFKLLEFTFW